MPFQIVRNDITAMRVDAIVNAANAQLQMGGGVCGAIFSAAGPEKMQAACDAIGSCPTGQAVITPGFDLPAKWVIHTVGPVWQGGFRNEEIHLSAAYANSLRLARLNGLHSIAFPLISSGVYGYPKEKALQIALRTIRNFLMRDDEMDIYLVVFDSTAFSLSQMLTDRVESYIDEHFVRAAQPPRMQQARAMEECHFVNAAPKPSSKARSFESLSKSLEKLLSRRHEETFSEMLLRLVDEKGFAKDSIVYKRANLERSVFSKLRSNKDYTPSKSTAVALCIALELNLDQTRDLLTRAGYALSPSNLGDVIVSCFIENGLYDIFEINAALFQYDQPCLGAKG